MKILHVTHHNGCKLQLDFIGNKLGYKIETQFANWNYNIGHQRAFDLWNQFKDYYNTFDIIITSDTCPLSRIFLQNNYSGKLIIHVSNRFDYTDESSNDCKFPDEEFYNLIRGIKFKKNVKLFPNTKFEIEYAKIYRNVILNPEIIKPCSFIEDSVIESNLDLTGKFYISQYHNHTIFMNLKEKCDQLAIDNFYGRYNKLSDLEKIKGIINIPYAWSTISLFENLSMGNVFFLPSKNLFLNLCRQNNFWFQDAYAINEKSIELAEWYDSDHKDIFIYFDSWEHLRELTNDNELIENKKKNVINFSKCHNEKTINQWKKAFSEW